MSDKKIKPNISKIAQRARPHIQTMKTYESARSLAQKDEGMIFLDANECGYEPFIGGVNYNRYPDPQPPELMDSLARLYDISTKNFICTRGADEAILILIDVFCEPYKDQILYCPPTFAMYHKSAEVRGVESIQVPLTDDFQLDVDAILNAVTPNTKLVFTCSPNNPTANLMGPSDIERLLVGLKDKALVVVDETYIEFTEQESFAQVVEKHENLVVLRTLSKSYAGAGFRCGVAIAQQEVTSMLSKGMAVYPVPAPVVDAVVKTLQPENKKRLEKKRQDLLLLKECFIKDLKQIDLVEHIYPSDANFILVKCTDSAEFVNRCKDANIIIRDQSSVKGLENCVRFSIGAKHEMDIMLEALKGTYKGSKTNQRRADITRQTKETSIQLSINLDANAPIHIHTGVGFFDHMLEQIAKHGDFSLTLECEGDLEIDNHHTIEDCAIALGQGLKQALGNKAGIGRYGFHLPMDEAQASVLLDLSDRYYLKFEADFPDKLVGDMPVDLVEHVFRSLAENLGANCHVKTEGENTHHMVEACFKAFGRAFRQAKTKQGDELPSTKGVI